MFKNLFAKLPDKDSISIEIFLKSLSNDDVYSIFLKTRVIVLKYLKKMAEQSIIEGGKYYNLSVKEIIDIQTVFVLKSLTPNIWSSENEIDYISSDEFISNFLNLENKFRIFYYNKDIPDELDLKKKLVKVYHHMIKKLLLKEKIVSSPAKTILYISLNIPKVHHLNNNFVNVSFKPLDYKIIKNKLYLCGESFVNTVEVLRSNSNSNKYVQMSDFDYITKISKIKVNIDKNDFFEIVSIYEKHFNVTIEEVPSLISNKLNELRDLYKKYEDSNNFISKYYSELCVEYFDKYFENIHLEVEKFKKIYIDIFNIKKINDEFDEKKFQFWFDNCDISDIDSFIDFTRNNNIKKYKKTNRNELFYTNKMIKIFREYDLVKNINSVIKEEYFKKKEMHNNIKKKQKEFSELLIINNLNVVKNMNLFEKDIYFPFFFDFRARKYDESSISVTNFKASRFFYNYGRYTIEEINRSNNFDKYTKIIYNHSKIIEKTKSLLKIKEKNAKYVDSTIFWSLIALGKEFIDKKNKYEFETEEILKKGYDVLDKEEVGLELEEKIIISHYRRIILSLNEELPLKRFILKDATASFMQNLIRILGPRNEDSLEKANLMSLEKWYDMYSYSIKKWKETLTTNCSHIILNNKKISLDYLSFFTRKNIKKSLMTASYDSKFITRWKYFIENIDNTYWEDENLKNIFDNYNNFIENEWEEIFLSRNSKYLIEIIIEKIKKKSNAEIESNKIKSDIIYYKKKYTIFYVVINVNHESKKTKKMIPEVDVGNIDYKKTKQAVKANWAHFSDAEVIREINSLSNEPMLSIHDCFLVDMLYVSEFIHIANEVFRKTDEISLATDKKIFKKIESLYIFI